MKKIILSSLTLIVLLVSTIETSAQSYSGGSGTLVDPYLIANKTDLKYLSENSGEWSKHFQQTTDLTFSDADFQVGGNFYNGGSFFIPIGNLTTNFTGSYNGDGKKITNLKINRGASSYVAFFGFTSSTAQIMNLGIINATINITSGFYTGGLVGWNVGTINNCYVHATIVAATHVGGLVGNNSGVIQKCFSIGSVHGGNRLGGLVGVQQGAGSISNSYSSVALSSTFQNFYGGLVGQNSGSISYSYSSGTMNVNNSSAGGLTGSGGASNSYWDTETSGYSTSAGGTGKTTAQMKTQSTFVGWDFTTIWGINGSINSGYPYLQNIIPPTVAPTTQASNIIFSNVQNTQFDLNWTNGNGSARAVFVKQTNTGTASPVDNTTYTANTTFGTGSQIGASGWYCVYNGTGTSVIVNNLSPGTEYRVMVSEYNGSAGSEVYNINIATNNPLNQTTVNTFPVATTSASTNVTSSSATLNGSVNPNGLSTDVYFEWSTDNTLTTFNSTTTQSIGSGTSAVDISANLSGLLPNTTYYFRAVGVNSLATVKGSILSFTTLAAAPTVTTTAANTVLVSSSTLNGTVNPNGSSTDGYFEWGTDNTLTTFNTTATQPLGSGFSAVNISQNISPLLSNTTYYFRAVGVNSEGTEKGSILNFTTSSPGLSQWVPFETQFIHSLFNISFVDGDATTGFAVGEQGTILRTTNNGVNWSPVLTVPGKWFNSVQMFSSSVIYAVGTYGMIYKSINGGTTWIDQSISGNDKHFRSVHVVSATEAYAVGYAGTFYSTIDGGATPWVQNTQIPWTMHSIAMSPDFSISGKGTIAATDGRLYRRQSNGTWVFVNIQQTLGVYDYLNSVVWLDNNNAIIVGNNGRILKTSNAGVSWAIKTSPTGNHLRAVEFIGFGAVEFIVVAVGDNGTILRSQGLIGTVGNIWTVELSNTTKNLYGVSLPSVSFGFTIGEVGIGDDPTGPASYVNRNLSVSTTAISPVSMNVIPQEYELLQNFPNPFNPMTTIRFGIPESSNIKLNIYDMTGRLIQQLVNENLSAGYYEYSFNASRYSSGTYFYRLEADDFVITKKMMLLK